MRVDVAADPGAGVFEQVLDQLDPSSWTVEFVPGKLIGGAGRRAETAVDTAAQDGVRLTDIGLGQSQRIKLSLHGPPRCRVYRGSVYWTGQEWISVGRLVEH